MDLIEACAAARAESKNSGKTVRVVHGHNGKYELIYHTKISCLDVWALYRNGRCITYTPYREK